MLFSGFSTEKTGKPSGVTLISAVVGERGDKGVLVKGPGSLAKALGVDRDSFDGMPLSLSRIRIYNQPVEKGRILRRDISNVPENCVGYFYLK
jgi:3-methyladenine DNA glycosylase Mpg